VRPPRLLRAHGPLFLLAVVAACRAATPAPDAPSKGVSTQLANDASDDPPHPSTSTRAVDEADVRRAAAERLTKLGDAAELQCSIDTGTACFRAAQELADDDAARAEALLARCTRCPKAPPAAFRFHASLLSERDAQGEARDVLHAGTRAHAGVAMLWTALARTELELGRTREALSAFDAALRLSPDDEELARERRDVLTRLGSPEDRAEADVAALITEAAGRAELDDLAGAQGVLETALVKAKGFAKLVALVQHRLALVYVRRSEPKKALAVLDGLLAGTREPELRADALVTRSEVLLGLGRAKDAIRDVEEAVALTPRHPLAWADLAIARVSGGDRDGAMKAFHKAVELGLARRLTREELLAIGPIAKLRTHPDFDGVVDQAWGSTAPIEAPPPPKK
jgi:tetratricopeptide (TPR) repeat protein